MIDFHSHFYDSDWFPSPTAPGLGVLARAWPLLTNIEAQLKAMDEASINAKVLSAPDARPVLETAAKLDIPIFVHPISPAGLTERLSRLGHTGILLARGTETAASLLSLLRSGVLDDLPDLKLVLPMIGAAVFLFAGIANQDYEREEGWQGDIASS